MKKEKTILFVGAGLETVPGLQLAQQMGLHVVASDISPNAPALQYADDVLIADTYDVEGTVAKAEHYHRHVRPIDGLICQAVDVPLTVATVANRLGLPGIPFESARLASDKLAMKICFQQADVAIPWFSPVENISHLQELIAEHGEDLVLKPVDSRGARGVQRLSVLDHETDEVANAVEYARSFSPAGRIMVERYLDGPQLSTESLVVEGAVHTVGYSDRNYELLDRYAPFFIENGGDLPTRLSAEVVSAVDQLLQQAADSMGITDGVLKGDIVIHNGTPYVIEVAARLSGGYFCSHQIPMGTGVDLVGAAIRQALGETIYVEDLQPRFQRHISQRYLFPAAGRIVKISGVEEVNALPDILLTEVRAEVGDIIAPVENHPGRAGLLMATGGTREEAVHNAEDAVASIMIETTSID